MSSLKKLQKVPAQIMCATKFVTNTIAGICVIPYLLSMILYIICFIPKLLLKLLKLDKIISSMWSTISNTFLFSMAFRFIKPYTEFFMNSCYRCKRLRLRKIKKDADKLADKSYFLSRINFCTVLCVVFLLALVTALLYRKKAETLSI